MNPSDELVRLIESIVDKKLKATTLNIKGIVSSGDLTLSSMRNIRIQTGNGGRGYYNGTEILTGSGTGVVTAGLTTNYIPKATASAQIGNSTVIDTGSLVSVENDLKLYKSGGTNYKLTFQHPTGGSAQKAEMYLFTGLTVYDFYLYSAGRLEIHALSGVLFDDPMAGNIAMGGYKLTGLAAGSVAGDSVRYEQVLLLAGGTMSGAIAMGSQKITGLAAGSVNGDALRYEQLGNPDPNTGKTWLNDAHTAWLIMNGNDCELHLPANGALVTVIG